MTNAGGSTTPAGWYNDPGGSGHLRWWDGTAWSAHLAPQPTPAPVQPAPVQPSPVLQAPVLQAPVLQAPAAYEPAAMAENNVPYVPFQGAWNSNPQRGGYSVGAADDFVRPMQWNTAGSWLLAFSGVLSLLAIFLAGRFSPTSITTAYGAGQLAGSTVIVFFVSLFFAEADRRKLRSLGYLKVPSLWWMLLSPPLAYLIVRTVVVWGEVRRGLAPLITYLIVTIGGSVLASIAVVLLLPGAFGLNSSAEFAASLQTGLNEKGGHFTVTCPASIPTTIGAAFSCTAIDSAGTSHTLTIQVITGSDGKPGVKLVSVTPPIAG
jgi:hypothetical protein